MTEVSKNKQLARNLVFNIVTFVINLGISFVLSPYLIKHVGKEAYGFYPLIHSMIGYTTIITTAFGSMGGRFITMAYYKKDYENAQGYFNSVLFANWMLSLAFSLIFLVCFIYLPSILSIPDYLLTDVRWLFAISGITMLLGLCTGIFGLGTYVKNRIDLSSSRALVSNVINVLVIFLLFYLLKPSIVFVAIAGFVAAIFTAFYNIQFKFKLIPELKIAPFKYWSSSKIKELLSSGVWNSINQLSSLLLTQVDLLIANIFVGAAATGDYAVVKVIPNFIYSLLATLSGTFTANFNILYAQEKHDELIHEIKKSIKIVGFFICIPIGFLVVFAQDFFQLWVPTLDAVYLYKLSLLTFLPLIFSASINPVFGVFTITNKLRVPSLVLLGAGIANTLVVLLLLKTTTLGLWAIPIVGAVQMTLRNFFFTPMYAAKCLNQKLYSFYPTIIKACLGVGVMALIGVVVKYLIGGDTWLLLILEGIIVSFMTLVVNFFLFFNKGERKYLIEKVKTFVLR